MQHRQSLPTLLTAIDLWNDSVSVAGLLALWDDTVGVAGGGQVSRSK